MLKMLFYVSILSALLLINLVVASSGWGYPNLEADEGFPHWGGLCDSGTHQSPIDLNLHGSLKGNYGQLKFENYDKKQDAPLIVNNGHSIQIYNFPKQMKLEGGPLNDEYIVEQLHFHWWSEHRINNVRYALECHIVHVNERYSNISEAALHQHGIAVVAILYHASKSHNYGIENILKYIDNVKDYEHINKPIEMKEFTVSELLPEMKGYFTYDGSLTTPTCAESVTWIVLHETLPVTLKQVEKFKHIEYEKDKLLLNNYREVQKNHNRPVVTVTYDANEKGNEMLLASANTASGLQIASLSVLVVAAFMRFLV